MATATPYPTGINPVAFDLSQTMGAITQQMIKTRQKQLAEQKSEVDANELAILKSLDFDTIKDLGDVEALKQAERLKTMTDKWVNRYKERGGLLSAVDKIELIKDRRDVEEKMNMAASDIAQLKFARDLILDPKNKSIIDQQKSWQNYSDYIKKGLAGSGGAINIIVKRPTQMGIEEYDKWDKEFASETGFEKKAISTHAMDNGKVKEVYEHSNLPILQNKAKSIMNSPDFANLAEEVGFDRAFGILNSALGNHAKKFAYEQIVNKTGTSTTSKQQPFVSSFFPGIAKNINEETAGIRLNNLLDGLARGDKNSVETLKGFVKEGSVKRSGNNISFTIPAKSINAMDTPVSVKLPDPKDKEGMRIFKEKMISYLPSVYTEGISGNPLSFVNPSWQPTVDMNPLAPQELQDFIDAVDLSKTADKTKNDTGKDEHIAKRIKSLIDKMNIPNIKTDYGTWTGKGSVTLNGLKYNRGEKITLPDGTKIDAMDKLKNDVLEAYKKATGYSPSETVKGIPVASATVSNEPIIDEEQQINADNIKSAVTEKGYDQYVDEQVDAYTKVPGNENLTREQIIEKIKSDLELLGISPETE